MNIAEVIYPVFNPYKKPACEVYVSGCSRKCKECHNPELQNYYFGEELNIIELISKLKEAERLFDIISITGGDLLCQDDGTARLFVSQIKINFPIKEYWLFTGADRSGLSNWVYYNFDYIKIGKYDYTLKKEGFPSSANQKLLKKGVDY
jgi:hypothetical protein